MTKAVRLFILGEGDQLFRLPAARYRRMVRQPARNPLASLAGRQARFAEAVVELRFGKAVRVVRMAFWNAYFDRQGVLDTVTLGRQCVAALDTLLAKAWPRERADNVIEAASQFVANGGTWTPTPALRSELVRAALGKKECVVFGGRPRPDARDHGSRHRVKLSAG